MVVLERKIVHDIGSSFSHIVYPRFVLPRHKHAEYELMLFTSGTGRQFVGEGAADYGPGDMALIGSNVPHLHLCDTVLKGTAVEETGSSGEVLQFPPDVFPADMGRLPDYRAVHELLRKSQYGIRFYDLQLFGSVLRRMREMDRLSGMRRMAGLLCILDDLARCGRYALLSATVYNGANSREDDDDPVSRVYRYLFNHFREKVVLQEMAERIGRNPAALCRYFKRRTDKSIFRCLAEIRIEHACKLLSCSRLTVSQVAYESGFNHLSHFNRQFRELVGTAPGEYRERLNGGPEKAEMSK